MMNWVRRVDPAFYNKEPHLLRTSAQIPRYSEDAQAAARLDVVKADRFLHVVITIVALCAYGLVTIPAEWSRTDSAMLGIAIVVAVVLSRLRGRLRATLTVAAIGVLLGAYAHPISVAPLVGMLAAGASLVGSIVVAREWRARPQVVTWASFGALLLACAFAIAFNADVIQLHLPLEIAAIAVAYLGVCVIAGRIRRAELLVRPEGVLSLPQSIVPLLDRSQDHAVICWTV